MRRQHRLCDVSSLFHTIKSWRKAAGSGVAEEEQCSERKGSALSVCLPACLSVRSPSLTESLLCLNVSSRNTLSSPHIHSLSLWAKNSHWLYCTGYFSDVKTHNFPQKTKISPEKSHLLFGSVIILEIGKAATLIPLLKSLFWASIYTLCICHCKFKFLI